ncbi:hypothetical protein AGDE_11448 [Angomonas deanei]|uniref:Transmembrane protein n=1 Tax=Angomonas deanei TaxID=59799 RepID=A0A7G2CPW7_9TRYP|nr:hypothetical protein AGDE_11448 [Angomonas deanei]CAD2221535.1 hypothetical protein, conserved [Angomonas deanei]|eukprot:EPY26284.1 hypothetical protein AGDE_11448 [Angomonas deanei]
MSGGSTAVTPEEAASRLWSISGFYQRRSFIPTQLAMTLGEDDTDNDILPLLLYDEHLGRSNNTKNNNSNNNNNEAPPSRRVPAYIARKINIPPPSAVAFRAITLAPPISTTAVTLSGTGEVLTGVELTKPPESPTLHEKEETTMNTFDIDAPESKTIKKSAPGRQKGDWILLSTTTPAPSQLFYLLPIIVFLADLTVLILSVVLTTTTKRIIAACCVLIVVPDVLTVLCYF